MPSQCPICKRTTYTAIVDAYYTPYCNYCHFFDFNHKSHVEGVEFSLNPTELKNYTLNDLIMFNKLELVAFLKLARKTRNNVFLAKEQNNIDCWIHICKMLEAALIYHGWKIPERIYQKTLSALSRKELQRH
ncbi:hypothetical protein EFT71_12495 [Lactiplantibacillus plantarum]|nr:hypothetical protein [Lactiplantibacillus plantarum]MCT3220184.1 hypothetical protein [Lactiplantibacillus plantarum]MCT3281540.1 hypothetical protein [Lactiplantibacillus plantarum]